MSLVDARALFNARRTGARSASLKNVRHLARVVCVNSPVLIFYKCVKGLPQVYEVFATFEPQSEVARQERATLFALYREAAWRPLFCADDDPNAARAVSWNPRGLIATILEHAPNLARATIRVVVFPGSIHAPQQSSSLSYFRSR